jgi:hypothetical protein
MGKKKIILTQKQLDEVCGDNYAYLEGLALTPDLSDMYSNEITTNGGLEGAYPNPTTTDDYADDFTNNTRGYWGLRGMGSVSTIREMTKKEWEHFIFETNQRLKNRNFGVKGERETYYSTTSNKSRLKKAQEVTKTGSPEEKAKAFKTIRTMQQNNPNLQQNISKLDNAMKVDKMTKPPMKSAPKTSGNGKAHSPKKTNGGVFINELKK